jgi:uncharacterized protein YdaU (DUF1376 family)
MTTREIGAYTTLLFTSISQPNPGYLNTDEEGLARIAKLTPQDWAHDRKRVFKKFKHNDLGYHNPAMLLAITEQLEKIINEKNADKLASNDEKVDIKTKTAGEKEHPLQKWIDAKCTFIKRIEGQLTYRQCESLLDEYKIDPELIKDKIKRIENTKDAHKKWNTVYLTLKEWCLAEMKKK